MVATFRLRWKEEGWLWWARMPFYVLPVPTLKKAVIGTKLNTDPVRSSGA